MENVISVTQQNVRRLCDLFNSFDFDINVLSGRVCVDGKSLVGMMGMCGRVVTAVPVTYDDVDVAVFERELRRFRNENF